MEEGKKKKKKVCNPLLLLFTVSDILKSHNQVTKHTSSNKQGLNLDVAQELLELSVKACKCFLCNFELINGNDRVV